MENKYITQEILNAAFKVHSALGPGLLESAYQECLHYELIQNDWQVEKQKILPIVYNEVKLDAGYRIDLFVEESVVVEIKAVESIQNIHIAQVITYLKLSKCKVGLLLNFNVTSFKNGIRRISY